MFNDKKCAKCHTFILKKIVLITERGFQSVKKQSSIYHDKIRKNCKTMNANKKSCRKKVTPITKIKNFNLKKFNGLITL